MGQLAIPRTRRVMLRGLAGAGLVLPATLAFGPGSVGANHGWCKTDPVITLDGYFASIYLSAHAEEWELNNSSGDILIQHPKDVATNLVWVDPNGYFGQGVSTNFATNESLKKFQNYMEIKVKCRIPASSNSMQIRLEWAPGPVTWQSNGHPAPNPVQVAAEGFANEWITLSGTLPYV